MFVHVKEWNNNEKNCLGNRPKKIENHHQTSRTCIANYSCSPNQIKSMLCIMDVFVCWKGEKHLKIFRATETNKSKTTHKVELMLLFVQMYVRTSRIYIPYALLEIMFDFSSVWLPIHLDCAPFWVWPMCVHRTFIKCRVWSAPIDDLDFLISIVSFLFSSLHFIRSFVCSFVSYVLIHMYKLHIRLIERQRQTPSYNVQRMFCGYLKFDLYCFFTVPAEV